MISKSFTLLFFVLVTLFASAQPGKDGSKTIASSGTVINAYTALLSTASTGAVTISATVANLNNGTALAAGDLLLIIGMQGADMNTSNAPAYGTITGYNSAGLYEFAYVCGVTGASTITLQAPLANTFTVGGRNRIQVVRVPLYTTLTINAGASVVAPTWNGATGGIVAAQATGIINLNGMIDVSGLGFRGGKTDNDGNMGITSYVAVDSGSGAEKGEGIYGYRTDYDAAGGRYCRGAAANGGGGGNAHNSGGGGGANGDNGAGWNGNGNPDVSGGAPWTSAWNLEAAGFAANVSSGGGRGGYTYAQRDRDAAIDPPGGGGNTWRGDDRRSVGGLGGRPLTVLPDSRIFLGGGGGAGDGNNNVPTSGANGGGIVYLVAASISGSGSITANGQTASNSITTGSGDAPGGGGGGGSIIIKAAVANSVSLNANGGKGGDQIIGSFESEGPGGGGGGGVIAIAGGLPTRTVNAGANGISTSGSVTEFTPNGATKGAAGQSTTVSLAFLSFDEPSAAIVGPTSVCSGNVISLTATGGNSYAWSTGATTTSISVSAIGTYRVTVTRYAGCIDTASFFVVPGTPPNVTIAPPASLTCVISSVSLSASSATVGALYHWSNGGASSFTSATGPGTYVVTVTDPATSCTGSASVIVNQSVPLPNVSISPPVTLTCLVTSQILTASSTTPGATFNWSGGGTSTTKNINSPGAYVVTVTDPSNGCIATTSVTVVQNVAVPNVSISTPVTLNCITTDQNLMASSSTAGVIYSWSGGGTSTIKNVTSPGTYTVTVTNPVNGCINTTSVAVAQNIAVPNVAVATPGILTCTITGVTLTATSSTPAATYYWGNGFSSSSNTVSSPGTYYVTVTDPFNGCTASTSRTVTQNITLPDITILPHVPLTCSNTSVTLTASSTTPGATFEWDSISFGTTFAVSAAGNYMVIVTNPTNGCQDSLATSVLQDTISPGVAISTPAALTCSVVSVILNASSGTSGVNYSWSGGGTGSTKTISSPGLYSITATNPSNGCTSTNARTVVQNIIPPGASIAPPVVLTCALTTMTLTSSSSASGVTYNWSGGGSTATKNVTSPGNYFVTITETANGCTSTASATVTQNIVSPGANVSVPATGVLTCTNNNVTLSASSPTSGVTYSWSGGGTGTTKTVSTSGTHSVTVTNPVNGCTSTASVNVIQNISNPNVTIAVPAALTCTTLSVTLNASSSISGVNFIWSGGGITSSKTVSSPGSYSVTVTDPANGCMASASVSVNQNVSTPGASIASPATLTCATSSVILSASSPTSGVNYNWSGGGVSSNKNVSSPGSYSVTITDPGNGCTSSASVSVTQSVPLPNISIAPPQTLTCAITSTTLTASSTTPSVTFLWSGGGTTPTKTVTAPGNYSITITDPANGCMASATVNVLQNIVAPSISIAPPATLSCVISSLTLTASSSIAGTTYSWSGGGTGASKTVSSPGNYFVTATDPVNACTAAASVNVLQNNLSPNVSITTPSALTCSVLNVSLIASSSTTGVTYIWSNGGSTATAIINTPGYYSVTVTNPANGCTASASAAVSQNVVAPGASIAPPAILTCAATSVTLAASSPTSGVAYNWSAGSTSASQSVSSPGACSLTVTNPANGCSSTVSVNVSQNILPPGVSISPPSMLTCSTLSVPLIANSTSGVSYNWSGGGTSSSKTISTPGIYSITATEPLNGCTSTASATVAQNIANPDISIATPAKLTCTVTNITLTARSITPSVSYNWSNGFTTAGITVNNTGNFSVTATDPVNGCTANASVTVSENVTSPGLSIATPGTLTCSVTSVLLTASSPATGATFVWSAGSSAATQSVSSPGNYSVSATDPLNGCTAASSVNVIQSVPLPDISIATPATLTCTVLNVTLTASSNTPAVTFSWGGGGTGTTKSVSLPGNYSVTVTDPANGCKASTSVNVLQNLVAPNISIAPPATLTCATSSITLNASSTTPSVNYNWGGGNITSSRTIAASGNYAVTATDPANGCTAMTSANVVQNIVNPNISISPPPILTCSTLSVSLNASSTPQNVSYLWSGGEALPLKTVSSPGNYSVTVTDPVNGCTSTADVDVSQNIVLPGASITPPQTLTCAVTAVILTASSSASGANYTWSAGSTSSTQTVSAPGNYSVTTTDPVNSCASTASVNVIQSVPLPDISIAPPATLTCVVTDILLTATSITSSVTYAWSGGGTGNTKTVSAPGNYSVTVTDPANGCMASTSVAVIQNIIVPNVAISIPKVLTCSVLNDTLIASSGSNVNFIWSGGATGSELIVSVPGSYSVTATDVMNGCSNNTSSTVLQNIVSPPVTIANLVPLTCSVTSVILNASSPVTGAHYDWGGGVITNTNTVSLPGNYTVTVTDPVNGCTAYASMAVTQNIVAPDVSILPPDSLTCLMTQVTLQALSGSNVTYDWGGGINTSAHTVSTAGNYTVTATDVNNGCTASASAAIIQIVPVTANSSVVNVLCHGGNTGAVDVTVSGGMSPYAYTWNQSATTEDIANVPAGNYSVTLTDAVGCSVSIADVVSEPELLSATESHTNVSCNGGHEGYVDITVTGGVTGYTYLWSDGVTSEDRRQLTSGNYSVTITDSHSCSMDEVVTITEPSAILISAITNAVACHGGHDGSVILTTSGGTSPYTYHWNDGPSSKDRSQLSAGNYLVTAYDANQCTTTSPVVVTEPSMLSYTSAILQPTCVENQGDGSIVMTANGGTPPYLYRWSNGTGSPDNQLLLPGSYSVSVMDANQCSVVAAFVLQYQYQYTIDASPAVSTIESGKTITLGFSVSGSAGTFVSQKWSPSETLSCDDCASPDAAPEATTTYEITVVNEAGCPAKSELTINVIPGYDIFLPNVFTPNWDGVNDFFEMFGNVSGIHDLDIQVFNRWGEKVFQSSDHHFQWNGTFRGESLTPQVLVWQLQLSFLDGHTERLRKGAVTLLK